MYYVCSSLNLCIENNLPSYTKVDINPVTNLNVSTYYFFKYLFKPVSYFVLIY